MPAEHQGLFRKIKARAHRVLLKMEERLFGVVSDLTRVTNDGGWQANSQRSGQTRPDDDPPGGPHRGIPGG